MADETLPGEDALAAAREWSDADHAAHPPAFGIRDMVADGPTALRFTAILGLQMGQIFPAAFFGLMLTAIYRENGLALDMFWVFALPSIPIWLRPLWAPIIDGIGSKRIGRRKSWFVPCTLFGAIAYTSLAAFEPTLAYLWPIIGLLVVKTTIMTTQDIAIDGYMVENLSERERGAGAAVMDIGRNVATFTSFALVVAIYGAYGWDAATLTAAGLLLAFSMPAMIRREPPPPREAEAARSNNQRPSLIKLLRRPDSRYVLPMVFQVSLVGGLIPQLYVPFLVDAGFTVADIGPKILAPATAVGSIVGASLTVVFLNRFGYKRTILAAAFLIIPSVVPIIWLGSVPSPSLAAVFLVTLNGIVLPSFLQVAIAASRLKWASRSQAATDYTVQIVTMSGANSLALAIGGFIAAHTGWLWYFAIAGSICVTGCFVFYLMFDRIERMVEARDHAERDFLNTR